jgi:hypothetical protein
MKIGNGVRWIEIKRNDERSTYCTVFVVTDGMTAEASVDFDEVYPNSNNLIRGSLVKYLEELAKNWKGWDGEKRLETTESEFNLSARHNGVGHIKLQIEFRNHPWMVKTEIDVEPGNLDNLVADAKTLFENVSERGDR